ncbi:MAG: glutaredoxin domain-containing protein [Patescibacteria group bacterium]|jgi:glutaredoxin-like YruB-family protein
MEIKIYSTPTCPWCTKAKELMDSLGLTYENVDVSSDESKARELIEKTGQMGVPVIVADGEVILGYDVEKINALKKE